ncbi:unnamed protein product, partial [Cyprideis torosa]
MPESPSKTNVSAPGKKLPAVPETLLKRRKKLAESKAKAARKEIKQRRRTLAKKSVWFKRAEQYVREYRAKERDLIRLKRQVKAIFGF